MDGSNPTDNRKRLPVTRAGETHSVTIGRTVLTFTVGRFENRKIGELFINELSGEDVSPALMGALDAWAIAMSLLFQSGYPKENLFGKFKYMRFEPDGFTDNEEIPNALSLIDYIMKWIEKEDR